MADTLRKIRSEISQVKKTPQWSNNVTAIRFLISLLVSLFLAHMPFLLVQWKVIEEELNDICYIVADKRIELTRTFTF